MAEDKIIEDKRHLKVVDLTDVIKKNKEESDKVPEEIIKNLEILLTAAKENKLKSAIIFFEVVKGEEQEKEETTSTDDNESSFPVLFFWEHRGIISDLYVTANYLKNYIYNVKNCYLFSIFF